MRTDKIDLIRHFIVQDMLFGDESKLQNDTSFMNAGIIDSTGILELVAFIENTWLINIHDEELIPENLDSLVNLQRFLDEKLACVE